MLMKLKDLLLGVCRFEVKGKTAADVLNILMTARIVYRNFEVIAASGPMERSGDGSANADVGNAPEDRRVIFYCSYPAARRFARLCEDGGIEHGYVTESGIPAFAVAAIKRPGLILGAVAALLLLCIGERVIWGVRVVGADDVISATEVRELFADAGVYPGAAISGINGDHSAAHATAKSDRLAWAAVNIRGTTAVIEVRSQVTPEKTEDPFAVFDGVNLVAARDGLVVDLEIISGKPAVRCGDTVRAGELLVSGVIDSTRIGFRLTHSEGVVRAETLHTVSACVPYKYQKREYSGESELDVWINFFSKRIDIIRGYGSVEGEYNSVCSLISPAPLSGDAVLPVGLGTCRRIGYRITSAERTPAEAARLCEFELSRLVANELGEGDYIVRRTTRTHVTDDGVMMDCEMVIAENIAKRQGFYLADAGDTAENKQ